MKIKMKSIVFITILSLFNLTAFADVAGNYQCQRVDSSNNTTSYPLIISKNGDTYTFEWDNSSGFPALNGVGIMHPSVDNAINVTFSDPKDANNFGVELFVIKSDGSLQSTWAVQSTNQLGTETCTKK